MSLSTEEIRHYVKDNPLLNILLEGNYQSCDELIALAKKLSIGDFNIIPPVTQYLEENFPSDTVMLYGILHHLANSEAERQLRNQITYNAQGLNAGIDDKYQQYLQLAQYYKGLFDQGITSYKQSLNIEKAWGGSFSPYAGLNTFQYRQ